ncbi:tRNA modification GTPase trmE [Tranquillimonas rosea]|uniref:tRNA modification GTPase MnmE n=1 Tax=Tranquillimonas rosea TaxID=641238 RepID=A0A1H9UF48_9RHOB|nr:tRNA uridine-5-carboxymethylaminomethyl(34) synthesis GTPase MnmE [Tranquillimonas rosea]SES08076.1 tRNA modification GTPase trmE [Tranquillimonas rosea]
MDTIYALASARGKSGVAVIRISGPQAFAAGRAIAGALPAPRSSAVRHLRSSTGEALDKALVLTFSSGASFTGEDTVEFQIHGSPAIIDALMRVLSAQGGLRMAEPGEFTRRALENGRLDLTQVEGLGDLIDSETELQRRQALDIMSGKLGGKVDRWRGDLIRAAALLEAVIDFADEEVPTDVLPEVRDLLAGVISDFKVELAGASSAERIRDGFEVAILGRPNVGKSTLLNALAGRDAAITSSVAGTTRDVIEVRMDIGGLPVTFLDTAGLRDTEDEVEAIGVARARQRGEAADLRVFLQESADEQPEIALGPEDLLRHAKSDLSGSRNGVSGLTGDGVDQLVAEIEGILSTRVRNASSLVRERQRIALTEALGLLESATDAVSTGNMSEEVVAEEIRRAIRTLERLVGRISVDDVLDEIFASFCLGK